MRMYTLYNLFIISLALWLNPGCGKVTYEPGPMGSEGPQGQQGNIGATGATGNAGATGAIGPTGATGGVGATGAQGIQGEAGTSCSVVAQPTGAIIQCTDGSSASISDGSVGAQGATGPQGAAGEDAMPCTTTAFVGGVNILCPDGTSTNVYNGTAGAVGPAGTPGTLVVAVEFCPSLGDTVYPSSFPEYGLCIEGNIYAVYWSGTQAFMAEVVPGVYDSTSPQGCSFTVATDCSITED